jgi:hypothetical protein
MGAAIFLFPLYAFMAWIGTDLPLPSLLKKMLHKYVPEQSYADAFCRHFRFKS